MRRPMTVIGKDLSTEGSEGKKGGGGIGQKLGAVAGGVVGGVVANTVAPGAAPATGWAVAQGAGLGAAGGAALGSMLGETVSPSTQGQNAMQRRAEALQPGIRHSEQSEQLKQSLVSLQQAPQDIQKQYGPPLVRGYVASVAKDNPRGGMA